MNSPFKEGAATLKSTEYSHATRSINVVNMPAHSQSSMHEKLEGETEQCTYDVIWWHEIDYI